MERESLSFSFQEKKADVLGLYRRKNNRNGA